SDHLPISCNGRRNNCVIYGILYGCSCITKHFASMPILMIGRFLGGIATSILYSAFESWVVYEHNKRGFSDSLLGTVFSHAALGNSLIAILAGVVAQLAADAYGFVAPFDLALMVMAVMCLFIIKTWPENYGDEKAPLKETFIKALHTIKTDVNVLCLGLVQSLFEGSMYTFVLEWTPALSLATFAPIPHGYIFASFMVATMMGSSIFQLLTKTIRPENFMRYVLLVSAVCLAVPVVMPNSAVSIFVAFLVFELCVGIFWPAMGYLRGTYVPEETRSTTINLFRIPLNLIVIFILWQNFSMTAIFQFCVLFLLMAALAQHVLFSHCTFGTALPEKTPIVTEH
ncbi:molybdate-anion transporter, partial [Trichostrongylus colubriformis]